MFTAMEQDEGSSPRVWGQVPAVNKANMEERIIPTRMGTRINYIKSSRYRKDHPHAYGDKYFCQVRHRHVVGSSPRVWGQVDSEMSDGM